MTATSQLVGTAGWTDFGAVLTTVLPLLVLIAVLAWYVAVLRHHP